MKKTTKRIIIYVIVVIAIIGVVMFLKNKRKSNIVEVKTTIAKLGDIKAYLSTTAIISSKNEKSYYGLQGKVSKVNVSIGDRVKKDDVLVVYEEQDFETAIKQAQLQYNNAVLSRNDLYNQNTSLNDKIANIENQIKELEESTNPADKAKLETLKQQKSSINTISDEKLKQSDNSVELALLNLNSAKKKLSDYTNKIVAENDGVVTALNITEGSMSSSAQAAIIITDLDNLEATVSLGKYDSYRIKEGQSVIVNGGKNTYNGKVSLIYPTANKVQTQTGGTTITAKIDITDKAPDIKINFDVDVDILTDEVTNILKVPVECIKEEKGNKNYVFILDGSIVHKREVELGIQSDSFVEIKKGLSQDEKIVLNPSNSITDGLTVKEYQEGSK